MSLMKYFYFMMIEYLIVNCQLSDLKLCDSMTLGIPEGMNETQWKKASLSFHILSISCSLSLKHFPHNPFPNNNFKFDRNDRKFSKRVQNTVGKEEFACYKQFLLFQQCFLKTCTADT